MNEGWKCPVCGRGVSPSEKHCDHGNIAAPVQPVPVYPYTPYYPYVPWTLEEPIYTVTSCINVTTDALQH